MIMNINLTYEVVGSGNRNIVELEKQSTPKEYHIKVPNKFRTMTTEAIIEMVEKLGPDSSYFSENKRLEDKIRKTIEQNWRE